VPIPWIACLASGFRACSVPCRRCGRSCERRVGNVLRNRSRHCARAWTREALPRAEEPVDRGRYAAVAAAQRGARAGGDIGVPRSTQLTAVRVSLVTFFGSCSPLRALSGATMWLVHVDPILGDGPSATFGATRWSRDVSTWWCSGCLGVERGFAGNGESRCSRCSVGDRMSGLQFAGRWPGRGVSRGWSTRRKPRGRWVRAHPTFGAWRCALSASCGEHAGCVAFVATRA
jgi:hypothetical protein